MAVLFLVLLFSIKNGIFQNFFKATLNKQENGLAYSTTTVGDLVNKDSDGDGIPDWEEKLYGTDPTKKETTPGIPDSVAIEKLKPVADQNSSTLGPENLTQTDKFSRELFATVATGTQNGDPLNQSAIDQIGSSLANQIQNSAQRKIFQATDIKITKDVSVSSIKKYNDALNGLYPKTTLKYTAMDVMQRFLGDGTNVDVSALADLDPIISQSNTVINGMQKISVPQSLAPLHLNFMNSLEGIQENLSDLKLYDTDPIVAFKAINQYDANTAKLEAAINDMFTVINVKLKQQ